MTRKTYGGDQYIIRTSDIPTEDSISLEWILLAVGTLFGLCRMLECCFVKWMVRIVTVFLTIFFAVLRPLWDPELKDFVLLSIEFNVYMEMGMFMLLIVFLSDMIYDFICYALDLFRDTDVLGINSPFSTVVGTGMFNLIVLFVGVTMFSSCRPDLLEPYCAKSVVVSSGPIWNSGPPSPQQS